jgi:8-oxo-dGTP diphosphatase
VNWGIKFGVGFLFIVFTSLSIEAGSPCFKHLPALKNLETVAIARYGEKNVYVSGVALATRNGKILLGKRLTSESGSWAFAGGKMENNGENLLMAVQREFYEETGLWIELNRFRYYRRVDHPSDDGRFYASYLFLVELAPEEEPRLMEPDKTEMWAWFEKDKLPSPLFSSNKNLLGESHIWQEVTKNSWTFRRQWREFLRGLAIAFRAPAQ